MRPNLYYFILQFEHFNKLCFDGKLERPPIRLNTRLSSMGLTIGQRRLDKHGNSYWEDLSIEISVRLDLPEEEYIDTLLHEMIHYWIMSNNFADDSTHGHLFRSKMEEITRKHGLKVSISFKSDEEQMINARSRWRYICVAECSDGGVYLAVVAKTKVFQFWKIIPTIEGVTDVHWYASNRQIFEQFPVRVTPRLQSIDSDKLQHYLTGAQELENTGHVIRAKQTE